jgi:hypothetical protein
MYKFKLVLFNLLLSFSIYCSNDSLFPLLHCSFPLMVIDDYKWKAFTLYSPELRHNVGVSLSLWSETLVLTDTITQHLNPEDYNTYRLFHSH